MQLQTIFDLASNSKHGNFWVDLVKTKYRYHIDSDKKLYACQRITGNKYSKLSKKVELSIQGFIKLSNKIEERGEK